MLHDAIELADDGPVAIRYPRGQARQVAEHEVGIGLRGRRVRRRRRQRLRARHRQAGRQAEKAAERSPRGRRLTVWDVRSCARSTRTCSPTPRAPRRGHVEDGVREGGIGMTIADHRCTTSIRPRRRARRANPVHPPRQPDHILTQLGLDADGHRCTIRERC